MPPSLQLEMQRGVSRAIAFLARSQRADGSWHPLWFGNEHAADEANPTCGTARVLGGLATASALVGTQVVDTRRRGVTWLVDAQNADGGWGGAGGVQSSVEETGFALSGLASSAGRERDTRLTRSLVRGCEWLIDATGHTDHAVPIGLYFARLWYYEELYPLIFALHGLAMARRALARTRAVR
jgi:squalene-hopene/tetraprenyl-beta-curcumene cyclase